MILSIRDGVLGLARRRPESGSGAVRISYACDGEIMHAQQKAIEQIRCYPERICQLCLRDIEQYVLDREKLDRRVLSL